MSISTAAVPQSRLVAVSSPGGLARQVRVQYRAQSTLNWHWYASFQTPYQAQQCVDELQQDGVQARLVDYLHCPASC